MARVLPDGTISIENEFALVQVGRARDDDGRKLLWLRDAESEAEVKLDAFFVSRLIRLIGEVDGVVPEVIARSIPGASEPLFP